MVWYSLVLRYFLICPYCIFRTHENGGKQETPPDFSSEVGSSAHHFSDNIKDSRMSLISLDMTMTLMMMMMMMMTMMMMHHYSLTTPNIGSYDLKFENKISTSEAYVSLNRSKKSWNPWQCSRKPILLENQISSSVFAAWCVAVSGSSQVPLLDASSTHDTWRAAILCQHSVRLP